MPSSWRQQMWWRGQSCNARNQENQLEICVDFTKTKRILNCFWSERIIYGIRPLGFGNPLGLVWWVSICSSNLATGNEKCSWVSHVSLVRVSLLFMKPSEPTKCYAAGQSDVEFAPIASWSKFTSCKNRWTWQELAGRAWCQSKRSNSSHVPEAKL